MRGLGLGLGSELAARLGHGQLAAGHSWRGAKDGYAFTTGRVEPIYPIPSRPLMTKLIRAHNQPDQSHRPRRRIVYAADSRYAVVDAAVIVAAARG